MDTLGEEQLSGIEIVLKGHNLVITGSTGTGKSHTVKDLTEELRQRGNIVALSIYIGYANGYWFFHYVIEDAREPSYSFITTYLTTNEKSFYKERLALKQ